MRLVMINLGEEVSKEQVDDVIAAFDEDGDGEISPDEFAAALKAEKLLGTESLDKETGSAGDKAKNRWAGANSYEDVIAQIGVQDESPQAIDRLDGAVMARDSELLAARLKNADRGLLNPTGQLMTYWDFFTLGALFFTATVTPYEVCLMWLAPTWAEGTAAWLTPLFVLNIFVNLIFMVDIVRQPSVSRPRSASRGLWLVALPLACRLASGLSPCLWLVALPLACRLASGLEPGLSPCRASAVAASLPPLPLLTQTSPDQHALLIRSSTSFCRTRSPSSRAVGWLSRTGRLCARQSDSKPARLYALLAPYALM
jgi:hypothetical protein